MAGFFAPLVLFLFIGIARFKAAVCVAELDITYLVPVMCCG